MSGKLSPKTATKPEHPSSPPQKLPIFTSKKPTSTLTALRARALHIKKKTAELEKETQHESVELEKAKQAILLAKRATNELATQEMPPQKLEQIISKDKYRITIMMRKLRETEEEYESVKKERAAVERSVDYGHYQITTARILRLRRKMKAMGTLILPREARTPRTSRSRPGTPGTPEVFQVGPSPKSRVISRGVVQLTPIGKGEEDGDSAKKAAAVKDLVTAVSKAELSRELAKLQLAAAQSMKKVAKNWPSSEYEMPAPTPVVPPVVVLSKEEMAKMEAEQSELVAEADALVTQLEALRRLQELDDQGVLARVQTLTQRKEKLKQKLKTEMDELDNEIESLAAPLASSARKLEESSKRGAQLERQLQTIKEKLMLNPMEFQPASSRRNERSPKSANSGSELMRAKATELLKKKNRLYREIEVIRQSSPMGALLDSMTDCVLISTTQSLLRELLSQPIDAPMPSSTPEMKILLDVYRSSPMWKHVHGENEDDAASGVDNAQPSANPPMHLNLDGIPGSAVPSATSTPREQRPVSARIERGAGLQDLETSPKSARRPRRSWDDKDAARKKTKARKKKPEKKTEKKGKTKAKDQGNSRKGEEKLKEASTGEDSKSSKTSTPPAGAEMENLTILRLRTDDGDAKDRSTRNTALSHAAQGDEPLKFAAPSASTGKRKLNIECLQTDDGNAWDRSTRNTARSRASAGSRGSHAAQGGHDEVEEGDYEDSDTTLRTDDVEMIARAEAAEKENHAITRAAAEKAAADAAVDVDADANAMEKEAFTDRLHVQAAAAEVCAPISH